MIFTYYSLSKVILYLPFLALHSQLYNVNLLLFITHQPLPLFFSLFHHLNYFHTFSIPHLYRAEFEHFMPQGNIFCHPQKKVISYNVR